MQSKGKAVGHPAAGCTKAQLRVFEMIAMGEDRGHSEKVLKALLEKGLIEHHTEMIGPCHPGGWAIVVEGYRLPPILHYRFCRWCDENISDEAVR